LRLIRELQAEDNPNKDAYWIAEYARVEQRALSSLADAKKQEEQYQQSLKEKEVSKLQDTKETPESEKLVVGQEYEDENDPNIKRVLASDEDDDDAAVEE